MKSIITAVMALGLVAVLGLSALAAQGDVLRVRARNGEDIRVMDPAHYIGNEEFNIDFILYSKLMKFKPSSSKVTLDAAKSIDFSDDGKVISFTLKKGIQFHHGYGEMTAEDVKFSFERIIDPDEDSEYASEWETLDHVEVTGRYSGKIILKEPFAPLLISTIPYGPGSIISKKAYEELGQRFKTHPIGSGPYYWDQWKPNQKLVLKRFDDYYGEKPDFARIEVLPISEYQIAEIAFDRGELDVTEISLDSIDRYRNDPNVDLHISPALRYHWVGFNQQQPPFDDIRVREAVRYTIDVDEVLTGAYNNVAKRANAILPEGILGHWDGAPEYKPNLEKAKELLAEAGYPDGFETTLTTTPNPPQVQAATVVQQQLARVGIDAKINVVQDGYSYLGKESHPGMHYMSFSSILDPGYWFEWFTCRQVDKWNYLKWCNPEYDRIKNEAGVTMDSEKRAALYVELQKIMDEDIPLVWITNGARVKVSRKNIDPVFLAGYNQYAYWKKTDDK